MIGDLFLHGCEFLFTEGGWVENEILDIIGVFDVHPKDIEGESVAFKIVIVLHDSVS